MKRQKNKIEEYVDNSQKLYTYLKEKAQNHNHYKSYGEMNRIVKIRDEKSLYLGNGEKWNDIFDRKNFNSDQDDYVNFGKCFSYLKEESVAMWMLYGGIDKKSGMIDFTKKGMKSILSIDSIELGFFQNDQFESKGMLTKDQFEIYLIDIIYYTEYTKNECENFICRSDEMANVNKKVFKECKKSYPWRYESECRLIVKIKKDQIPEKCDTVKIDLKNLDLGKSLERVYHGPNYPCDENSYNTEPSRLGNSIDWDLCKDK